MSRKQGPLFRYNVRKQIQDGKGLHDSRHLCLSLICRHVNDDGLSWPGLNSFRKYTGLDTRTIIESVQELQERGMIQSFGKKNILKRDEDGKVVKDENGRPEWEHVDLDHLGGSLIWEQDYCTKLDNSDGGIVCYFEDMVKNGFLKFMPKKKGQKIMKTKAYQGLLACMAFAMLGDNGDGLIIAEDEEGRAVSLAVFLSDLLGISERHAWRTIKALLDIGALRKSPVIRCNEKGLTPRQYYVCPEFLQRYAGTGQSFSVYNKYSERRPQPMKELVLNIF